MSCVNIRGCRIGEGRPKVILPIVERTEAAILEKAAQFSTLLADCVEWRADWFEGFQSPAAIARCVQKLRVALRDKLLLVTFRTKAEGGEQALSHPEYLAFLHLILDTDCADLLDIEFFTAGADLPKLVEQAHSAGAAVVCSSHDFHKTPPRAELVNRMVAMQQAGADLVFLPIYYQPASLILSQADAMGYTPTFFGVDGMDGILTMKNFDPALAEGVMLLTPFNADATDEATVNFVTKYQELYGETPNQFAADAYDCVYAYKLALETAGCTPDMSAADLNAKMKETFPTITFTGLTGDGAGITWDATGAVSKSPKGMVIQNGAYAGMD